jgi:aspartate carbamoyltransferase regulatory subunit
MGKQKDAYNKCNPTDRQIKKQKKNIANNNKINVMSKFLEQKWNNEVVYKCGYCLQEAYNSEVNNIQGYVTDEELIISSNNKLKHK